MLQQNSNASLALSSVLPDGLRTSLMLIRRQSAPGPDNRPDTFM